MSSPIASSASHNTAAMDHYRHHAVSDWRSRGDIPVGNVPRATQQYPQLPTSQGPVVFHSALINSVTSYGTPSLVSPGIQSPAHGFQVPYSPMPSIFGGSFTSGPSEASDESASQEVEEVCQDGFRPVFDAAGDAYLAAPQATMYPATAIAANALGYPVFVPHKAWDPAPLWPSPFLGGIYSSVDRYFPDQNQGPPGASSFLAPWLQPDRLYPAYHGLPSPPPSMQPDVATPGDEDHPQGIAAASTRPSTPEVNLIKLPLEVCSPPKLLPKRAKPTARNENRHLTAKERNARDELLLSLVDQRLTYRDIRRIGGFKETESTLRGRIRLLRNPGLSSRRKPMWGPKDTEILERVVNGIIGQTALEDRSRVGRGKDRGRLYTKIRWTNVAQKVREEGASYPFGPGSCSKRWFQQNPKDGSVV